MIKHRQGEAALSPVLLWDGAEAAPITVAFAHGAGQPMDSAFMRFFAEGWAAAGLRVARFEFPYMAAMRRGAGRRPPDRAPVLRTTWRTVIAALAGPRLVVAGKSMGGRIGSEVADEAAALAVVCLGYPFHPPGRPGSPRIAHLAAIATPTLICQGTRDPFGTPAEVAGYPLSPAVRVCWIADGDHGFAPRAGSRRSERQNWEDALAATVAFIAAAAAEA